MDRKDYLRAKIAAPQVTHKVLSRSSITAILNTTPFGAAICLIAPYGYGKTLSVISYLHDTGQNAVWISLDATDNSEQAFFAGLSAALLRITGWQGDVNTILSSQKYIENPQEFLWEAVTSAEQSGCDKVLVMDNFRVIRDRELLRSVRDIVCALLGRWRVIIMSRAEMPPIFADLILRGQICLITPKELSFSPEEMAEFFALTGCNASLQNILDIRGETEGWPALLNVVSMLSRGGDIAYTEAARGYVMIFFETEIWDGLEEHIKDFLLKTSVLNKLTPEGCRAVTDMGATLPMLQWLFINGLFMSMLGEKDTYYYHPAFRDFLLSKLVQSDIDEQALYRKLGWWLFDKGEITQSLACFFKSGELQGINQVLKIINPTNMGSIENFLEAVSCITELDMELLQLYPIIMARIALIYFLTGDVARMQSLYKLLIEWIDSGDLALTQEEYTELLWETGWLCYLDPDEPTMNNKKHEDWLSFRSSRPKLNKIQVSRSSVLYFPSMLRGVRDYGNDGLLYLEAVIDRFEAGETGFFIDKESKWQTYLLLAELRYEHERFAEAESIIRRVMSHAEEHRLTFIYFMCTTTLVKIIRVVHNPREISALTKRLETMITETGHIFLLPNFHAFELRNRLADGHVGFTAEFDADNKDYESTPYFFLIYRQITFARGLLSLGNYSWAMLILGNLELLCKRYKRPTDLTEINILKAVTLYHLGYEDEACRYLKEALAFAERYGFVRMFSDDAAHIWPVLELVRKQAPGKFIQQIIISCKKTLARSGQKPSTHKFPHTELTKTELKILKAIQSGMSYAEIAQDNGVRMSTVKSQLHSIYSKLEVNNRTAAVIAAQNAGILKETLIQ